MKKTFTKSASVKKLASYSAMAGAFVLANSGANAQIVYTDIPDETLNTGDIYDLDMNDDGDIDLTFGNASQVFTSFFFLIVDGDTVFYDGLINFLRVYPASGNGIDAYVNTFPGGSAAYPNALNNGDNIGDSQSFAENSFQFMAIYESVLDFGSVGTTYFNGYGPWKNKNSKFMGVRFTADGDDYYGWVRLTTEDFTMTIEDYAYMNVPEATIGAGDMPTGIENTITDEQLNVYSFGNTINIIVKDLKAENAMVNVFNVEGKLVYTSVLNLNGMNIVLNNQATGNYTLQVLAGTNDVYTKQLYIQH